MTVFQLKPESEHNLVGGMALVAAPTFEIAKNEYVLNGNYGEMVYFGEISFTKYSDQPITGLSYEGGTQILCDCIYIE